MSNVPKLYADIPVLFTLVQAKASVNGKGYPEFKDVYMTDQEGRQVYAKKFTSIKKDLSLPGYNPQAGDFWYVEANTRNQYDDGKVSGVWQAATGARFGHIPDDGGAVPANVAPWGTSAPPALPGGPSPAGPAPAPYNPAASAPPAPRPMPPAAAPAPVAPPVASAAPAAPAAPAVASVDRETAIERLSLVKSLVALQTAFPQEDLRTITGRLHAIMGVANMMVGSWSAQAASTPPMPTAPPVAPVAPVVSAPAPVVPTPPAPTPTAAADPGGSDFAEKMAQMFG